MADMGSRSAAWWVIVFGVLVFAALILTKIWFASVIGLLIVGWGAYMLTALGGGADASKSGLQRFRER
jgi:hypothetical protein